jgi:hypothetical protein
MADVIPLPVLTASIVRLRAAVITMRLRRICGSGRGLIVGLADLLRYRTRGGIRRADNRHARERNEKGRRSESEFVCHVFHSFSCAASEVQMRMAAQECETDLKPGL